MNLARVKHEKSRKREKSFSHSSGERGKDESPPSPTASASAAASNFPKQDGWFLVGDGDKAEWYRYSLGTLLEYEFQAFNEAFGPTRIVKNEKKEDCWAWDIPSGMAAWKKVRKSCQCCAYTATDDYISHMLGVKMCASDKEWYESHPLTNASGLPMDATITVLNDLVEPYGLGVSRVALRKNTSLLDGFRPWLDVLGVNPAALVDRDVSNAEYVAMLPDSMKVAALIECDAYRLEFLDALPAGPWVVFAGVAMGTPGASGGGHATYRGPRERRSDWSVALQFDWKKNIPYHAKGIQPPTLPYEDTAWWEFDLMNSKGNDGRTVKEIVDSLKPKTNQSIWSQGKPTVPDKPKGKTDGYGKPISQYDYSQGGYGEEGGQGQFWEGL